MVLMDACTFDADRFLYMGGGFGLGFVGAGTIELGSIEADSPHDIGGWGWQVGGFAAAVHGATAQRIRDVGWDR